MNKRAGQIERFMAGMRRAALVFVATGLLAGCGAESSDKSSSLAVKSDMAAATPATPAAAGGAAAEKAQSTAKQAAGDSAQESKNASVPTQGGFDGNGQAAPVPDGFSRKLMYKANLVMEAANYAEVQTKVRDLVALSGGYILSFNETNSTYEKGGTFTLKVPASGFNSLLDQLEKLSPSLQRSIQGQDVSEEYVDLQSRLKARQVVEARLIAFMEKAVKTDELLSFSNELSKVQEEIERLKGRMRYIDQNVAFSTVELRVYQKTGLAPASKSAADPFGERISNAFLGSWNVVKAIIMGLIIVIVGAFPALVVLAIVAIPIWKYAKHRSAKLARIREQVRGQNAAAPPQEPFSND